MALDPALKKALYDAAEKADQPRQVAQRLVAWLEALSTGESSEQQDLSFYQNVMAAIVLPGVDNAD
ncbi:hypothetical protein LZ686_11110 [Paracoccus sp. NFXS7]|uniref:CxC ATPase DNA modification system associated small protein n=1 Tax=Paracoccus sp. NFXS7 TaxID=2908653 RepID=UPI0032DF09E0